MAITPEDDHNKVTNRLTMVNELCQEKLSVVLCGK